MKQSSDKAGKAIIAALVGNTIWGFSFMASKVGLSTAPVILLLSHRFLLAFLVMSFLRLTPFGTCRFRGKPLLPLLLLGLLEPVIYFFGEQYGILHSSTIFSGVMIALIPIVSTLAAIPVLGEKPTLGQLLCSLFRNELEESIRLLCLDAAGKLIKQSLLGRGDVNAVHFSVRKIVEAAVSTKAVSVILAHNHPAGTLTPSREDIDATLSAKAALDTIGVRLLDHLIICGQDYCSLREQGYL